MGGAEVVDKALEKIYVAGHLGSHSWTKALKLKYRGYSDNVKCSIQEVGFNVNFK